MRVKALILAGLVAAVATPAFAADLPRITEPPVVEPFPKESNGGWYLRGDIGYSIISDFDGSFSNTAGAHVDIYGEELEEGWWIGGGVGYRWNDWFRTDLTAEYRSDSDYSGRSNCVTACGAVTHTNSSSSLQTWLFLANAYVDLGHWYGISPYVGAGIGMAYHSMDNLTGVNSDSTPAVPFASGSATSFAAAGYAGMTYHFSESLALDANYRYLYMGEAETGSDGFGGIVTIEDMVSHDFRVGMRYSFN
jgi:opacity protein-like surface antigen